MIERTPVLNILTYLVMISGVIGMALPIYLVVVTASLPVERIGQTPPAFLPGGELFTNLATAFERSGFADQFMNSLTMAVTIVIGKIVLSTMTAFAITYFRFPLKGLVFWAIFVTLMLPLEVRIVPTYAVAANALEPFQQILDWLYISDAIAAVTSIRVRLEWNLLDSFTGLTLPLMATATGTFLYRQFFLSIPNELADAAKVDGAGAFRFFVDIAWPLSRTTTAALAIIMFISGWNQYLWPLLITTDPSMHTVVMGLSQLLPGADQRPEWNIAMAGALIVMLPPVLVVFAMHRLFIKGLMGGGAH
uniref:Putative sn-glycerol-3-phosphate transport system permease n=1 Tax=termite gut metagenome TaxID=433724 RepID=S0DFR7_9ZZZZ